MITCARVSVSERDLGQWFDAGDVSCYQNTEVDQSMGGFESQLLFVSCACFSKLIKLFRSQFFHLNVDTLLSHGS